MARLQIHISKAAAQYFTPFLMGWLIRLFERLLKAAVLPGEKTEAFFTLNK